MVDQKPSRRTFLRDSVSGLASAGLAGSLFAAADATTDDAGVPQREFGKTKEKISLLGVGGHHIGRPFESQSIRIIQEAIDHGATFLDNAWEYHDGESERRMGNALVGRRDRAFLMTKHHGRDKTTAMKHLEDSLRRLKTDRLDLWMFHECVYDADPDMIFAPGGGIEAAELAKQQGKVRYVGFTGHKWPRILLKLLAYDYPWDAVLMPLSILDGNFRSFEKWVLPVLQKRGIAALAMKTRASGKILEARIATVEECWRYVISLPIATVVSGMESLDLLRANLRMARELKPMTASEREEILKRTRSFAMNGEHELFKSTNRFDGPVGRKLHGV